MAITRTVRQSDRAINIAGQLVRLPGAEGVRVECLVDGSTVTVTRDGAVLAVEPSRLTPSQLGKLEGGGACPRCGEPVPAGTGRRGRISRYCSKSCSKQANAEQAAARVSRERAELKASQVCEQCGAPNPSVRPRRFCSQACNDVFHGRRRAQPLPDRTCEARECDVVFTPKSERQTCCCEAHGKRRWRETAASRGYYQQRVTLTCHLCGAEVERRHGAQWSGERTTCRNGVCNVFLIHGRWPSTPVPAFHPCLRTAELAVRRRGPTFIIRSVVPEPGAAARFIGVQCRWCDEHFVVDRTTGGAQARYCSARCLARGHKTRRSAFERHGAVWESVRPVRVYERDGWRCWLCRKKIQRGVDWADPMAATLDHVVPRSHGGDHTYANLRAAHRLCNSIRSNGGGHEQLAMFG